MTPSAPAWSTSWPNISPVADATPVDPRGSRGSRTDRGLPLRTHTGPWGAARARPVRRAGHLADLPEPWPTGQEGGHARARHVALALHRGLHHTRRRGLRRSHPTRGAA